MVGCVLSQVKPSELYILSCGKSQTRTNARHFQGLLIHMLAEIACAFLVEVLSSKNPPWCSDCDKSTKFHTRVPFYLLNDIRGTPHSILSRKMT